MTLGKSPSVARVAHTHVRRAQQATQVCSATRQEGVLEVPSSVFTSDSPEEKLVIYGGGRITSV